MQHGARFVDIIGPRLDADEDDADELQLMRRRHQTARDDERDEQSRGIQGKAAVPLQGQGTHKG